MAYKVITISELLRDEPDTRKLNAQGLVGTGALLEKLPVAAPEGWIKAKVATPGAPAREGFVRLSVRPETS